MYLNTYNTDRILPQTTWHKDYNESGNHFLKLLVSPYLSETYLSTQMSTHPKEGKLSRINRESDILFSTTVCRHYYNYLTIEMMQLLITEADLNSVTCLCK